MKLDAFMYRPCHEWYDGIKTPATHKEISTQAANAVSTGKHFLCVLYSIVRQMLLEIVHHLYSQEMTQ